MVQPKKMIAHKYVLSHVFIVYCVAVVTILNSSHYWQWCICLITFKIVEVSGNPLRQNEMHFFRLLEGQIYCTILRVNKHKIHDVILTAC